MTAVQAADITRIGVVGCGLMGSGIAEVCARNNCDVVVVEANDIFAARGQERIERSLQSAFSRGKLGKGSLDAARAGIIVTTDWNALADRQLVIEAVSEDAVVKVEIFRQMDEIVTDTSAILASNTSSIPIMKLATATSRPGQVIGMHFFNPVPVLPLIELVPSLMTSADTAKTVAAFAEEVLGKQVVRSQDRAGFVVNALLIPYLLSAIRMLESGFATAEDIDTGMRQGCAHPMGPLQLTDLIGLDTTMAVADSMYAEFKEPLYAPPPLLSRMVEAGLIGRKSGRGFYSYNR